MSSTSLSLLSSSNGEGPLRNALALAVTFGALQVLVLLNGRLQRGGWLPVYVTRKIIHVFAGPIYVVCWPLYAGDALSRYFAMTVPLAFMMQFFVVGFGLRKNDALVRSMSRSGDPRELLGGTMHYAIVMLFSTIFFFDMGRGGTANPGALLVLGSLAGGDGLADIIGRRFGGNRTFGFGGATKSPIGTLAMFVGSLAMILLLGVAFSQRSTLTIGVLLIPAIIVSLFATVAEAVSPRGTDNYTIAASVIAGILVLSALGRWPFGPLITL